MQLRPARRTLKRTSGAQTTLVQASTWSHEMYLTKPLKRQYAGRQSRKTLRLVLRVPPAQSPPRACINAAAWIPPECTLYSIKACLFSLAFSPGAFLLSLLQLQEKGNTAVTLEPQ